MDFHQGMGMDMNVVLNYSKQRGVRLPGVDKVPQNPADMNCAIDLHQRAKTRALERVNDRFFMMTLTSPKSQKCAVAATGWVRASSVDKVCLTNWTRHVGAPKDETEIILLHDGVKTVSSRPNPRSRDCSWEQ